MVIISENIQLQQITIKDQKELMALMKRIYPPAYKHLWKNEDCNWYLNNCYGIEPLEKDLLEPNSNYHFVIYKKAIVGISQVVYNSTFPDQPKTPSVYLNRIYLGEDVQGKGIAKQLLNWIETQAKLKDNTIVWLKAMDTQEQALKFYKKNGFKISSTTTLEFERLHQPLRGMYLMYKEL